MDAFGCQLVSRNASKSDNSEKATTSNALFHVLHEVKYTKRPDSRMPNVANGEQPGY